MDSIGDIGKLIVGGMLTLVAYWLFWEFLIGLPGSLLYSLLVDSEHRPDEPAGGNPSYTAVVALGICFWLVLGAVGYGVYALTK